MVRDWNEYGEITSILPGIPTLTAYEYVRFQLFLYSVRDLGLSEHLFAPSFSAADTIITHRCRVRLERSGVFIDEQR